MEENIGLFVIDLSECSNTGEIINNVSLALEIPNASGRGISLKLKDNVLNQSQILSIRSLIESYNSELVNVETTSLITQNACASMGIRVTQPKVLKLQTVADEENENAENKEDIIEIPAADSVSKPVQNEQNKESDEEIHKKTQKANKSANKFDELKKQIRETDETKPDKEVKSEPAPLLNETEKLQKQVITVYKKASDEKLQDEEDFEEVDFYAPPTSDPVVIDNKQTIYVNQTLRSGQTLEFDGNIVIIGDCHPGSEIKATGDITVWGVLGSIAHAGSRGNRDAKIRALKMNAVQLRIANCYSRRPDGGNIPYIVKSSIFTPEEARIVDDNIVLFKMANQ
jgi:septum site-determining protein MinC